MSCMGKVIESLVVEFHQAKYEEFLSSGSKSPRARNYRKVSSEIRSQVPSKASLNAVCAENIVARCVTRKVHVNISHETRKAHVVGIQPAHAHPLPQPQVTRGSQQPPYGVTGTLNIDRDDARVNYRRKKLE